MVSPTNSAAELVAACRKLSDENAWLTDENTSLAADLDRAHREHREHTARLRTVYTDRAHVVALLAALYPARLAIDPTPTDPACSTVVVVLLPWDGQVSWHIHDDDFHLFAHVPTASAVWDGHDTTTKHERIRRETLSALLRDLHRDRNRLARAKTAASGSTDAEPGVQGRTEGGKAMSGKGLVCTRVPVEFRSWSVSWPGYRPVDITPAELRPCGLAASVAQGWAEPYVTPQDVPDWSVRQEQAIVAFSLNGEGWPLNPSGRTGRAGRNLGKWGENQAADSIVVAGDGADRHILLIRRRDVGQWAIPGGMVDPGETAPAALVRELREETGVDLRAVEPVVVDRTYVTDWRATDHAWITTTVALFRVPTLLAATAGDDAADARWWPLHDLDQLAGDLAPAGGIYPAHLPLLSTALNHL